jgi:competence protein ComEA
LDRDATGRLRAVTTKGVLTMKHKVTRALVQSLIVSLLPAAAAWAGPVNINSADADTIAKELDGIGPAKAQAIVEYRQKNGPFRSAEDLLKVQGIGERVLDLNRDNIRLDRAAAAPARPASKPAPKPAPRPAAGG